MSMNLSCKLDDLQRGDRYMETSVALCEIRTQLQELTKSVESCHNEVSEVRWNFYVAEPQFNSFPSYILVAESKKGQKGHGYD